MTEFADRIAAVSDVMTAWTRASDPLLGEVPAPAVDEHVVAELGADSGRALAYARVSAFPATDARSLWGPTTADVLQLRLAEDATTDDVAEVLDHWLCMAPATPEAGGDHARVLRLPVAASQAVRALAARGFTPATSTLVRAVRARDAAGDLTASRDAAATDRDAMVALQRELLDTEVAYAAVREREVGLGDGYVDEALAREAGWTRVVEHERRVVGWASLAPPAESAWSAPSTSAATSAYLSIASVTHASRSRGNGSALAAALHARAHAAGVDATLLDASVLNPWSMPFWHRQGYRPLWTTWQRTVPGR